MASAIDLGCKLKNLSDVLTGDARGHDDWSIWNKIKIIFEIIEDFVGIFVLEISLRNDENNTFAGIDDLASKALIELRMRFSAIDEHAANIGLFNSGEAAESAEFLNTYFAFAWLAETSGV